MPVQQRLKRRLIPLEREPLQEEGVGQKERAPQALGLA
jgi:hypothetical protein